MKINQTWILQVCVFVSSYFLEALEFRPASQATQLEIWAGVQEPSKRVAFFVFLLSMGDSLERPRYKTPKKVTTDI